MLVVFIVENLIHAHVARNQRRSGGGRDGAPGRHVTCFSGGSGSHDSDEMVVDVP
jgi:hypothetical protein